MKTQSLPGLNKPAVIHKLTTVDLVRFMVAAFLLGATLGMFLPEAWQDFQRAMPAPTHTTR